MAWLVRFSSCLLLTVTTTVVAQEATRESDAAAEPSAADAEGPAPVSTAASPNQESAVAHVDALFRSGRWVQAWNELKPLVDEPAYQHHPTLLALVERLEAELGFVQMLPPATGRSVFVDGFVVSVPPDGVVPVLPGEHTFVLRIPGHVIARHVLSVPAGESIRLQWTPLALPRPPQPLPDPRPVFAEAPVRAPSTPVAREQIESLFRVRAAVGVLSRTFSASVGVDPALRPPFDASGAIIDERREYAGDWSPRGELQLEVFPWRSTRVAKLHWFGLVARFGGTLTDAQGLQCRLNDEPSTGRSCALGSVPVVLHVTQRDYVLAARAEGRVLPRLRLGASVGYDRMRFLFEVDELATLDRRTIQPSFDYESIRIEGDLALDVERRRYLRLIAGVAMLPSVSIGEEARRVWGRDSVGRIGFQFDVELTHEMRYLVEGLTLGLGVTFREMRSRFSGQPTCRTESAGTCGAAELWESWPTDDGSGVSAGGGVQSDPVRDQYVSFRFSVEYAYGVRVNR